MRKTRQSCIALFVCLLLALVLGVLMSVAKLPLFDARGRISGTGYFVGITSAFGLAACAMGIYSIFFLPIRWRIIMRLPAGPRVLGMIGGFGLILYLLLMIAFVAHMIIAAASAE